VSAREVLVEQPLAVRHDHRDAGPHRPVATPQRTVALDQRDRADAHAGHVGDRVARPGRERADPDPEFTRALHARTLLRTCLHRA
jgi:hypothetical protein